MNTDTGIEWTDATWNPVGGCEIESPGCTNCYAMRIAASGRLRDHPVYRGTTKLVKGKPVFNGMLTILPDDHPAWSEPLRWRGAKEPKLGPGKPLLIFVGDMCDLFHPRRPREDIDRVVASIVSSRHIGQVLTKRAEGMADYFAELRESGRFIDFVHPLLGQSNFAENVSDRALVNRFWLGISAERPQELEARWRHVRPLAEDGWQTFISMEPLLERMLFKVLLALRTTGRKPWVIVGGESGPDARPMHPDWVREIRDFCAEFGLPFFFKQWGEFGPEGNADTYADIGEGVNRYRMARLGKKKAGHLLDGKEWRQFPEMAVA